MIMTSPSLTACCTDKRQRSGLMPCTKVFKSVLELTLLWPGM
jgi:hypothetical protein